MIANQPILVTKMIIWQGTGNTARDSLHKYFIYSNLTKAIEHLQRIATVLHVLKVVSRRASRYIDGNEVFTSLDENFRNFVALDALSEEDLIIDYETCFNAKKLMDYFLSIKKILAGYDPSSNKILTTKNGTHRLRTRFGKYLILTETHTASLVDHV